MRHLKKNLILLASLIAFLFGFSYLFPKTETKSSQTANLSNIVLIETATPPEIEAKAGCVFDLHEGEFLFEKNISAQLPLASLTKLMTAVVAKERLPQNTIIKISTEAIGQDGDNGFTPGEEWPINDILDLTLISSSNDGAYAIASALTNGLEVNTEEFVSLMNKKAQNLNLYQTYFLNPTGLDVSDSVAGAYGSCEDIAKLWKYTLKNYPNLLEVTKEESVFFGEREFKNTNKLLPKLPSLIAGKTGFDDLAGGNLTVVVDKGINNPIIITILGSSLDGRFADVEKLYNFYILK